MGHKRSFFQDVVEGNLFLLASEEDRVRLQLQFLATFSERIRELWVQDGLWTQMGFLTGNSASTSHSNWSYEHFFVTLFVMKIFNGNQLTGSFLCVGLCSVG